MQISEHKFPLQYWEVVSADFLSTQACTILTFVKDEDPSSSIVTTYYRNILPQIPVMYLLTCWFQVYKSIADCSICSKLHIQLNDTAFEDSHV